MKNGFFNRVTLLSIPFALSFPAVAFAGLGAKNSDASARYGAGCDLSRLPLMRCELLPDYLASDRRLNRSYRNLLKKSSSGSAAMLRQTQRDWVSFRDRKCMELQEQAGCDNASCDGVEHAHCIVELTTRRSRELDGFLKDPQMGAQSNYRFEMNYPPLSSY